MSTATTQFDLTILLPSLPARDACYQRVADSFAATAGIESVHLLQRDPGNAGELCVHFDPKVLSLQTIRRLAGKAGAALDSRYGHHLADVAPMPPRRARRFASSLMAIPGVLESVVSPNGTVRVEFDREIVDETQIQRHLRVLGLAAEASKKPPH